MKGELTIHRRISVRLLVHATAIAACALLLAVTVNALSLTGIPWMENRADRIVARFIDEGIQVLDLQETWQATRGSTYLIFDARSGALFEQGHLPGSISLPVKRIDQVFANVQLLLSPEQPILVYCSGSACDESFELALFLKHQGYARVAVFADGFEAWRDAGYEIEYGV